MNKKMIFTLITALTIASPQAFPGQGLIQKYDNKFYFLAGYVSGAVSGTLLLARWLKNKYQAKKKDVKKTLADKIKETAAELLGS